MRSILPLTMLWQRNLSPATNARNGFTAASLSLLLMQPHCDNTFNEWTLDCPGSFVPHSTMQFAKSLRRSPPRCAYSKAPLQLPPKEHSWYLLWRNQSVTSPLFKVHRPRAVSRSCVHWQWVALRHRIVVLRKRQCTSLTVTQAENKRLIVGSCAAAAAAIWQVQTQMNKTAPLRRNSSCSVLLFLRAIDSCFLREV